MDAAEPVQPTDAQHPAFWWSGRRLLVLLSLLFVVILAISWWLTPIEPYATLNPDDECGPFHFSPDGTMIVTSGKVGTWRHEGPLRIWDVERGHERCSVASGGKAIETVLFSPDSSLLAAYELEGDLKLWNTRTGDEIASFRPETRFRNWVDFRFSPDGRFLVFQDYSKGWPAKESITFWNIESKQEQGSVESGFRTLAFATDGNSFATLRRQNRREAEVLLWTMDQTPVLAKQHRIPGSEFAFSLDLRTIAAAADLPDGNGQVAMWDILTGKKHWSVTIDGHGMHWQSLSFLANGHVLSAQGAGGNGEWRWQTTLWNVTSTPKQIGSFSTPVAVSPNGAWIATRLHSGAKLIHVSGPGRETELIVNGMLEPPTLPNTIVRMWPMPVYSPDSKIIVVSQRVSRVWDVASCRELLAINDCTEAQFSPDGRVLATLRERRVIDLWAVPFHASLLRVIGWAVTGWLVVVATCWLAAKTRRKLFSRQVWARFYFGNA